MNAFDKAWTLLKGNPNARVQSFSPSNGGYSTRDSAIHPAALGAANRQVMAENANRQRLEFLAQQQGGRGYFDGIMETARRMVTPEQRASIKNDSFDLKYKNPRFVSKIRHPSEDRHLPPLTDRERNARKIEAKGARVRRRDAGFTGTGLRRRKSGQ
jgi:hypothetical protein